MRPSIAVSSAAALHVLTRRASLPVRGGGASADLAQRPGETSPYVAVRRPGDPTHFPAWSPGASSRRSRPPARGRPIARAPASRASRVARPSLAVASSLTLVVVASTVVRLLLGLGMPSTWVLPDELVYSDLARSIAEGGRPAVRDVPVFGWGEVYPAVIAPVWVLVEDRYVAYHVTLALNAVLMSLAAIPAYFLARLVVSRGSSLLVATMTVVVPSLSYTDAVLTENAFYPLFLTAVLAIAHAVRRPSLATQAAALVAVGLVIFTRIQGVALLAAYAGAALLYCLTQPRRERLPYARRFLPTVIVAIPVALAPVVASVARGEGAFGWLGQRSGTFDEFHPHEVPYWFLLLAVGLRPLRRRRPGRRDHDHGRRRAPGRCRRRPPALRRRRPPDGRRGAAERRLRQRVARR